MTTEILAFIFGCILVLIGIIGGGLEVKELKVPIVGWPTRVIAIIVGIIFVGLGFKLPDIRQVTPTSDSVAETKGAMSYPPDKYVAQLQDEIESDFERAIIGTWKEHEVSAEGAIMDVNTSYSPNRRFSSIGSFSFQDTSLPIVVSGSWNIEDDYLHVTVESSNVPAIVPIGFSVSEKIISITDRELKFISDGEIDSVLRVK